GVDLRLQRGCELALLFDTGEHRRTPFFQFAQVAETLFQRTQLRVVEPAGHFLAIARDEGHGGAFVEERHGGGDLLRFDGKFVGEALLDGRQHVNDLDLQKPRTMQNGGRCDKLARAAKSVHAGHAAQPPEERREYEEEGVWTRTEKGGQRATAVCGRWRSRRCWAPARRTRRPTGMVRPPNAPSPCPISPSPKSTRSPKRIWTTAWRVCDW